MTNPVRLPFIYFMHDINTCKSIILDCTGQLSIIVTSLEKLNRIFLTQSNEKSFRGSAGTVIMLQADVKRFFFQFPAVDMHFNFSPKLPDWH